MKEYTKSELYTIMEHANCKEDIKEIYDYLGGEYYKYYSIDILNELRIGLDFLWEKYCL